MKNSRNVCRALMLLSLATVGSASVNAFFQGSMFEPFNELFEEMDPYARPTKSRETAEKDLRTRVKALQEEAKKLEKAATDLATQLDKKSNIEELPAAFDTINDCQAVINENVREIRKEARTMRRAQLREAAKSVPSYSLRSSTDEKSGAFVVTANLPSIAKEDLKITVKTTEEFGTERQTLHVVAQPPTTKSTATGIFTSSSALQSRYINGRREELSVEDGKVTIVVDLPQDASNDLAEVQKTMTLENGVLTLSFPLTKKAARKETELRFTPATPAVPTRIALEAKIK